MYKLIDATKKDIKLLIEFKLATILNDTISKEEKNKIIKYVKGYIPANIKNYKLIVVGNENVGCFSLNKYEDGLIIEEIYLLERFRNKGIGSNIIKEAINTHKILYLWVYKTNINAINLYERLGFKIIDETKNRYLMNIK